MKKEVRSPRDARREPNVSDWRSAAELLIGCFGCMSWPESFLEPGCWGHQRPNLKTHYVYEALTRARRSRRSPNPSGNAKPSASGAGQRPELETLGGRRAPQDRLIRV